MAFNHCFKRNNPTPTSTDILMTVIDGRKQGCMASWIGAAAWHGCKLVLSLVTNIIKGMYKSVWSKAFRFWSVTAATTSAGGPALPVRPASCTGTVHPNAIKDATLHASTTSGYNEAVRMHNQHGRHAVKQLTCAAPYCDARRVPLQVDNCRQQRCMTAA